MPGRRDAVIGHGHVSAYKIPTEVPESDGTLRWDSTTLVLVALRAGDSHGLGYTYGEAAVGRLIQDKLLPLLQGHDPMAISRHWAAMVDAIRNQGRSGMASMAIAAVDIALWDLKAKLLGQSVAQLLGPVREAVPAYGSGGFTSYDNRQLLEQLAGWALEGFSAVKMKVGREPSVDLARVRAAREAIGETVELFVDANGAYSRKQALAKAEAFAEHGVTWFEEPVSSDDIAGLRLIRDRVPAPMEVSSGEYGYQSEDFRRWLEAGAVDVLQADVTRCAGVTGFLNVAALCEAFDVPLSTHCVPSLSQHLGCALRPLRHLEYFHDHARIEHMLFDGAARPKDGYLRPDPSRPGWGLTLKEREAQRFAI